MPGADGKHLVSILRLWAPLELAWLFMAVEGPYLAAVLAQCRLALTNDSGGMHLATAMDIPVVAVFGITDPARTGPLGSAARVMQAGTLRSRDIRRDSPEARASLLRITPEQTAEAAVELMKPMTDDGRQTTDLYRA